MCDTSRDYRQARWNEPVIMEMSAPGERGVLPPEVEEEVRALAGDVVLRIPSEMRRAEPLGLPEISQARVLRHYLRLSQESLGADLGIDIGQGTCTMKYSPKINEQLSRLPEIADTHPLQDESTVQGILQIMYEFEEMMKEVSGMWRFSFQPGGGSQAILANASIIRAYHEARGESDFRNEIITSVFSHPVNAACARTAGFKVITLYPGRDGFPEIGAVKKAISERTAGMMITNPEDTGIFNPDIAEFVDTVHKAGGLCSYDQANANGLLGITRAREAGFDMCHFNLHKTFSSPHGSGGPGAAALGVVKELSSFLPVPVVDFDGNRYRLNFDLPNTIGKVRMFHGVVPVVLRAYAWVMSLGAEGLREVAEIATLNNNYLLKKMLEIPGVTVPHESKRRIEQIRYSMEEIRQKTGVTTEDIKRRVAELGAHYWLSHHPYLVPEPCTFEPTESYSRAEIDEFVGIIRRVALEAYSNPEFVKTAPHDGTTHRIDEATLDDPSRWAMTWRAHLKKMGPR